MTNSNSLNYFAYGSNMSLERLRQRVPSAERVGTYRLDHHSLKFHKVGQDGSGKCDAFHTNNPEDYVLGSLFKIEAKDKKYLDKAEKGYLEKIVSIRDDTGGRLSAFTYLAYPSMIDPSLKPFTWYLAHVLVGACENRLPTTYLNDISRISGQLDPNQDRHAKEVSIHEDNDPCGLDSLNLSQEKASGASSRR